MAIEHLSGRNVLIAVVAVLAVIFWRLTITAAGWLVAVVAIALAAYLLWVVAVNINRFLKGLSQ